MLVCLIDAGERYVELDPIAALVHGLLAMTLSYADRSMEGASKILPYKNEADLKLIVDALRKAGLK
jgi:hypothetical protein